MLTVRSVSRLTSPPASSSLNEHTTYYFLSYLPTYLPDSITYLPDSITYLPTFYVTRKKHTCQQQKSVVEIVNSNAKRNDVLESHVVVFDNLRRHSKYDIQLGTYLLIYLPTYLFTYLPTYLPSRVVLGKGY